MNSAERLIAIRRNLGLSQQAQRDRSEIHATLIRGYETGKIQPSADALRQIAIALHFRADAVLFDAEEQCPSDHVARTWRLPHDSTPEAQRSSTSSSALIPKQRMRHLAASG